MDNIRALLFLCFFTTFIICCGTLICYIKLKKDFGKKPKKKVILSIALIGSISIIESLSIILSMGITIQNMIFNGFFGGLILFIIIYAIYSVLDSIKKQHDIKENLKKSGEAYMVIFTMDYYHDNSHNYFYKKFIYKQKSV